MRSAGLRVKHLCLPMRCQCRCWVGTAVPLQVGPHKTPEQRTGSPQVGRFEGGYARHAWTLMAAKSPSSKPQTGSAVAHVEYYARDKLGLSVNPDAASVTRAVVRSAGLRMPDYNLPQRVNEWFVQVANLLSDLESVDDARPPARARSETVEAMWGSIHAWAAPAILAILAPDHAVPEATTAGDLLAWSKGEIKAQLPGLIDRVLSQWRDGALPVGGGVEIPGD